MPRSMELEEEDTWDDMAIVRAFEEALSDQKQRSNRKTKAASTKKKQSAVKYESEEDDHSVKPQPSQQQAASSPAPQHWMPPPANTTQPTPSASSPAFPSDLYQQAYAHAYAHLQQQQSSYAPPPPSYGYPSSFPMPPVMSSMPTPQFSPLGSSPMTMTPPTTGIAQDDALANVLLAWYQSGYYTGRFQALQEMKATQQQQQQQPPYRYR